MNGEDPLRRPKLRHLAATAVLVAIVWHEPGGSAEFAVTVLDKAGAAAATALRAVGFDGESDYFTPDTDPEPTDKPPTAQPNSPEIGLAPGASIAEQTADRFDLDGTADRAVVEIVELHHLVEALLAPEDDDQ